MDLLFPLFLLIQVSILIVLVLIYFFYFGIPKFNTLFAQLTRNPRKLEVKVKADIKAFKIPLHYSRKEVNECVNSLFQYNAEAPLKYLDNLFLDKCMSKETHGDIKYEVVKRLNFRSNLTFDDVIDLHEELNNENENR